ncbi:cytochrome ubiquinol oxidase subunit I [Streptomyces litchfieldiae]|uniref:Cytochrome ubiquinol oxidase subunit I n=1 Tax=Streptomyces litchfieldiae TaxID=3075543 RepID=A0ABU2MQL3_9ACTN|nr:cytochrome ubiquinol oxidase subunit I [Streptomyces sp. DSM 44938]MDT0343379.1 cytochrome ubiquinol oxidase subunit I [Streptomyces sp. DSM 44938]
MDAETLDLARWQFALTAGGHFLFVSLTLGLATILAVLQTRATLRGGQPVHTRMVRFWGQLYVINYAIGIVTGLVMEFQFGLAWAGLGHYAGDVFGASLALETVLAFFVESTFLALWMLGWDRFNKWVHLAVLWVVTLTAYLSAYWILVTNGFLNQPEGHRVTEDGTLELGDTGAMLTNSSALLAFGHIAAAALLTGALFMAGVSAYHLFRRRTDDSDGFYRRSLRIGVYAALPALFVTVTFGGMQEENIGEWQPMKLAVFEDNSEEIARLQAEMTERFGPGDYVPPEALTQGAGMLMMAVFGLITIPLLISAVLAAFRRAVSRFRVWHVVLMALVPLPYVAMIAGWVFREAGRQPWVVYGLLRTEDAVSEVSTTQMWVSVGVFVPLFALLIVVNWWLLLRWARRGYTEPRRPPEDSRPEPVAVATY